MRIRTRIITVIKLKRDVEKKKEQEEEKTLARPGPKTFSINIIFQLNAGGGDSIADGILYIIYTTTTTTTTDDDNATGEGAREAVRRADDLRTCKGNVLNPRRVYTLPPKIRY